MPVTLMAHHANLQADDVAGKPRRQRELDQAAIFSRFQPAATATPCPARTEAAHAIRAAMRKSTALVLPALIHRLSESLIGDQTYGMLIIRNGPAAKNQKRRATGLEEAPGSTMTGIDFPSLRGRG